MVTLIGKSRPAGVVGSIRIQALQTDEERRRLRSKSSNYAPPSPSDPDLDELPLLRGGSRRSASYLSLNRKQVKWSRQGLLSFGFALLCLKLTLGCSFCRNPQMEEDGGFDEREDVREDDNKSQPLLALWRGVKRYILAGKLISWNLVFCDHLGIECFVGRDLATGCRVK